MYFKSFPKEESRKQKEFLTKKGVGGTNAHLKV